MITIIGAGWYGCYIGTRLKKLDVEFEILEQNSKIFQGSSALNQNRLHQGYHYPRDYNTRITSKEGFEKFISNFPSIGKEIKNNIYAIHKDSYIDFQTYLSIFTHEKYNFEILNSSFLKRFKNYEGAISVEEKLIDVQKAKDFFLKQSLPVKFNTICTYENDKIFANGVAIQSEVILDCTYGQLKIPEGFFSEDFMSFVYKINSKIPFGALTIMNGEFYSIYPYRDDLYTVTGVKEGPINQGEFDVLGESKYSSNRRKKIENKILKDYKSFLVDFEYNSYFISKKTKPISNTDNRSTFILKKDNIYTICSGKIDTIFELGSLIESITKKIG